jgi:copper chaperone NosL
MKKLVNITAISLILFTACSVKQEPIQLGKDACEHCKMLIMDPRFGAVLTTQKGKNYKFDDLNCLAMYINQGKMNESDVHMISAVDFANPGALVLLGDASFLHAESIKSPMASGMAAFADKYEFNKYLSEWTGREMKWDEIKNMYQ